MVMQLQLFPPELHPLVFYGTVSRKHVLAKEPETFLAFQIVDPVFQIPMKWEVYTVKYDDLSSVRMFVDGAYKDIPTGWWGLSAGFLNYAKMQGEQFTDFVTRLAMIQGLAWMWVTPVSVLIHGNPERYKAIAEQVKNAMAEVFGEFQFEPVSHGQATSSDIEKLLRHDAIARKSAAA